MHPPCHLHWFVAGDAALSEEIWIHPPCHLHWVVAGPWNISNIFQFWGSPSSSSSFPNHGILSWNLIFSGLLMIAMICHDSTWLWTSSCTAGFGGASTCHGREASASRGSIEDSSTILTCFAHDYEHWLNIIDLLDLRLCSISYIDDHWWSLMTYWLHNWTSFWTSWWQPGSEKMSGAPDVVLATSADPMSSGVAVAAMAAVTGPPRRWDTARVGGQLQVLGSWWKYLGSHRLS